MELVEDETLQHHLA